MKHIGQDSKEANYVCDEKGTKPAIWLEYSFFSLA